MSLGSFSSDKVCTPALLSLQRAPLLAQAGVKIPAALSLHVAPLLGERKLCTPDMLSPLGARSAVEERKNRPALGCSFLRKESSGIRKSLTATK